ncbi:hypothetical protein K443DRAFT_414239 [Laccaria amethystina LaAM-08-1]|uniref:Uncharacterized protein n=1 Tax=Laccaria amethystina LaAM-08-1 TaxID=1095629 RepID=A0A0C9X5S8_9AGAR|nr:hypothetical protein K443DRAFT_414239 [Laccaria amethystina LaAM-08-1]
MPPANHPCTRHEGVLLISAKLHVEARQSNVKACKALTKATSSFIRMRYVDTTTPSRPAPTVIFARDLQPGMDNGISFLLDAHRPSSWRSSSGGTSTTRIVDPSDVAIA